MHRILLLSKFLVKIEKHDILKNLFVVDVNVSAMLTYLLLLLAGTRLDNGGVGDGADEVLAGAAVLVPVVRLVGAD